MILPVEGATAPVNRSCQISDVSSIVAKELNIQHRDTNVNLNIDFLFQMSYVIYLALLSYVVLEDSKKDYNLITWVVLAYALSLTSEELRQVIAGCLYSSQHTTSK